MAAAKNVYIAPEIMPRLAENMAREMKTAVADALVKADMGAVTFAA